MQEISVIFSVADSLVGEIAFLALTSLNHASDGDFTSITLIVVFFLVNV